MGELTQCNKCTWESIEARSKKAGKKVKLICSKEMLGWMAAEVDGEEVAWFMEMGDRCTCG